MSEGITIVTVRCVMCKATKEIRLDEVTPGDMPMCPACFSPMVAVEAHREPPPPDVGRRA